jgi:DNA-directed RNA polymerase specialized sigma24 family protein
VRKRGWVESARGTIDEFAECVTPHVPAMRQLAARLAGRTDGEDVVQDSLVRAWRRRETFRPERGSPRTWLLAIVADQARQRRRRKPEGFAKAGVFSFEPDVDLERAIARLAHRQRLAVELHYFVGLGVKEAAQVMGCAEGTVKSTLADARERLRGWLDDS